MPLLAAVALPVFILVLPLMMLLLLVPGLPADEAWLLRVSFPFLSPFSAVMWFILLHRVVTHGPSRYSQQIFVFIATVLLVLMMLILGVYKIG